MRQQLGDPHNVFLSAHPALRGNWAPISWPAPTGGRSSVILAKPGGDPLRTAKWEGDPGPEGPKLRCAALAPSGAVRAVRCVPCVLLCPERKGDRKSTRLNSSHGYISYAVFCLKKKKKKNIIATTMK